MSAVDTQETKEEVQTIQNPLVVEKFKKAGEIANEAVKLIIKSAAAGSKIYDLCVLSDKFINEQCSKIYNKQKDMQKGLAFPTCLSVNNVVGHFSPLEKDETALKEGDFIKIDLGVQIDGYIAVVAHTFVLNGEQPVKGRQADAILAAHTAAEAALRMMKPGFKNYEVSEIFDKISKDFKVNCVQGVLSHQLDRFNIDGEKVILNRIDPEHKVEECEFQPNEVWSIDVVMSTGEGKPRETGEERTTIFKRVPEKVYQLKMQASRAVFSDIIKRFPNFPFNMRELDAKTARFAIRECSQHELLMPYPVLQEKEGEFVAHFKFTVFVTAAGPVRITGLPVDTSKLQADNKLENDDVKKVLQTSSKPNKNKKPAKKEGDKAAQ